MNPRDPRNSQDPRYQQAAIYVDDITLYGPDDLVAEVTRQLKDGFQLSKVGSSIRVYLPVKWKYHIVEIKETLPQGPYLYNRS